MKTCEHLETDGQCRALKILKGETGVAREIQHLPKFALALGSIGDDGKFTWNARCVLANEPENQRHCDDFKTVESSWRGGVDIPHDCQPGTLY